MMLRNVTKITNLMKWRYIIWYNTTFCKRVKTFPTDTACAKKNETNGGCDHRCFQQCTYMHNHRHKHICAHIHMYVCVWTETYIHRVGWYFVTNWRIIYRSSLTKIYYRCKPNFLRQEHIQASIYHQEFHVTSMSANATALLCCIMTTFSIHVSLIVLVTFLAKKVVTPPLKTIKPMWIELLCFHLAEIGMIWIRDCSQTKSDTTLGRHSMQGQVGSSSSETTV